MISQTPIASHKHCANAPNLGTAALCGLLGALPQIYNVVAGTGASLFGKSTAERTAQIARPSELSAVRVAWGELQLDASTHARLDGALPEPAIGRADMEKHGAGGSRASPPW